jgi:predicted house-cleaning noncanonical NTP pyrophosphatase (MazG superfamily)
MSIYKHDVDVYDMVKEARNRLAVKLVTEYDYLSDEELEKIAKITELLDKLLELLKYK